MITYTERPNKITMKVGDECFYVDDWRAISPRKSQALYNHSPDGFAWGYAGSGPSQLALAILLELFGEEQAKRHYQQFKWDFISTLPRDKNWKIDVEDIDKWVGNQENM